MEFQKYSSLENVKQKVVNIAVDHGYGDIMYGVSEKIHGANFGIHWDRETGETKFSRRSGFLDEGETFYAHCKIETALRDRMCNLIKHFGSVFKTLAVYGEIYGGHLNGETAQGSKKVQKEVQYSPETQFAAFDLIVDGEYLSMQTALLWLGTAGFHLVPLIAITNSLGEALEIPNEFNSRVPGMLGYEVETKENIAEGVVIRPWSEDIKLPNGKHFILKNKNSKFKEDSSGKSVRPEEPMSEADEHLFGLISTYLNENRLNAVISKEKELTHKDFGRILGLFMQDAIKDFEDERGGGISRSTNCS